MQNIAIIGSTGSIGRAFLDYYSKNNEINKIYSFSRSNSPSTNRKIINTKLDFDNYNDIDHISSVIETNSLDKVIIATGILHQGDLQPEKSISALDVDNFQKVFNINTFVPALLIKAFFPLIKRNTNSLIGILSARVGSISDNRIGGWYAYRASKAALNMLIKTAAIELYRKDSSACLVGLHPGTVNTNLSKPFQGSTPKEKIFTPVQSVDYLTKVIEKIKPEDTGKILDWQGEEVMP